MAALALTLATGVDSAGQPAALATPESFAHIGDTAARSAALFTEAGKVLTSLRCVNCHPAGIPGHPHWHLAQREMAWQGKTLGEICIQIKDPARNGGRSLDELLTHMATDSLVGWAWAPGFGREPAPGTQKEFGALIEAWVKTGAMCPM